MLYLPQKIIFTANGVPNTILYKLLDLPQTIHKEISNIGGKDFLKEKISPGIKIEDIKWQEVGDKKFLHIYLKDARLVEDFDLNAYKREIAPAISWWEQFGFYKPELVMQSILKLYKD